jgi:S-adenosylmethionine-dependent methyltransferase
MPNKQDRIFDGLAKRFQRQIYDDPRGAIRLAILQDDLAAWILNTPPLSALDAGAGLGQMSIWLAQQGHPVTLLEPSAEMLAKAIASIEQAGLQTHIQTQQASIQAFCEANDQRFDVIICHAVLEWLAEPQAVLQQLVACLKPNGKLSLMFFNQHSTIMRRLIAGDLQTVSRGQFASDGKSGLAPISPLEPDTVKQWLPDLGLSLEAWSGVRCFYDYMYRDVRKTAPLSEVIPLERQYSRLEPWRSLARYQHFMCIKT